MKVWYLTVLTLVGTFCEVFALNSVIELPSRSVAESRQILESALNRLEADYSISEENTSGFSVKYTSAWYSPYSYDIFIGPFGDSSSLIRAESSFMWFQGSMSHAITDIVSQTAELETFKKSYDSKNIFMANALTLLSPGFGYWYMNSDSPFGKGMSFLTVTAMLGTDAFLLWTGAKTFYTHGFDPTGDGLVAMLILGGAFRLMVLPGVNMQLIAHNRMVSLGYKFRF
ncbi:MAG: hypothetical protein KDK41_14800 [Leptospiraceae bacterium]|nr:hypothetical protein [Leptospiraceae bacterium]MCB1201915.1 hypothetical protein [Leptospiraceae bacterium]